jgi:hypothetical protein
MRRVKRRKPPAPTKQLGMEGLLDHMTEARTPFLSPDAQLAALLQQPADNEERDEGVRYSGIVEAKPDEYLPGGIRRAVSVPFPSESAAKDWIALMQRTYAPRDVLVPSADPKALGTRAVPFTGLARCYVEKVQVDPKVWRRAGRSPAKPRSRAQRRK